ncbi:hypothetical protein LTR37_009604 [Vermiconidia calcicola]|uniref:Uncharacterized protein n=1 Tax=Vermiconidia calcicola TaxID=1690605 RepID=A0ACC3N7C7_9PEZI|nr:hypothetical protein LTR37_009604 [Vermiconidia calcicola]
MFENCILRNDANGKLLEPVTGLVFHYDADSSGSLEKSGLKPRVRTLKLKSEHLTVERMLKLVAVSDQAGPVPLYLFSLRRVLREIAVEKKGAAPNHLDFKAPLDVEPFTRDQLASLKLRLDLLESFMEGAATGETKGAARPKKKGIVKAMKKLAVMEVVIFSLDSGSVTTVDLSGPFADAPTACNLFDICFSIAKDTMAQCRKGLAVALDEVQKIMN